MKIKPTHNRKGVVVELADKDDPLLARTVQSTSGRSAPVQLKKILVPVDFSDCSRKALRYAVALARQFNASILLAHVIELHYGGAAYGPLDFPVLEEDFRAESQKRLSELKESEINQLVPVETLSRHGRPAAEIVQIARQSEVDLIVLATHGYTGLQHVLMGSTAENVVRHAPCPVLTVRERERDFIPG